jgi:hypothetical protein
LQYVLYRRVQDPIGAIGGLRLASFFLKTRKSARVAHPQSLLRQRVVGEESEVTRAIGLFVSRYLADFLSPFNAALMI